MTRLRWSSPAKEADPARVQREGGAVIVTSDSEEARKRQRARKKLTAAKKAAKNGLFKKTKAPVAKVAAPDLQPYRHRLQQLEAKLAELRTKQVALQAEIAPLTIRSKKKAGLLVLPEENVLALRKLRPIEADLAHQMDKLMATYRTAYRRVHGKEPPG